MEIKEDKLLDVRGQVCPMPIVKAAIEMKRLAAGQVLKILATDRGALADVPAWADDTDNQLLDSREEDGALVFYVRKGEA